MPRYDFECQQCGLISEHIYTIKEISIIQKLPLSVICEKCNGTCKQLVSKFFNHTFHSQYLMGVGNRTPWVGNKQDVLDEIRRHNTESEFGVKWPVALADG